MANAICCCTIRPSRNGRPLPKTNRPKSRRDIDGRWRTDRLRNNATVRLFGAASPAEMLGRSRLEFIHADCHAAVKERIKKLIQDAKPVAALDEKWFHLDGGVIDCQQGNQREITKEGLWKRCLKWRRCLA